MDVYALDGAQQARRRRSDSELRDSDEREEEGGLGEHVVMYVCRLVLRRCVYDRGCFDSISRSGNGVGVAKVKIEVEGGD